MTTEIEKQFFDTFGIKHDEEKYCYWECKKPELENVACNNTKCEHYRHKIHYPQITDRILLELICIELAENPYKCRGYVSNAEELKEYILNQFIHEFENDFYLDKEDVKQQVQALFEE